MWALELRTQIGHIDGTNVYGDCGVSTQAMAARDMAHGVVGGVRCAGPRDDAGDFGYRRCSGVRGGPPAGAHVAARTALPTNGRCLPAHRQPGWSACESVTLPGQLGDARGLAERVEAWESTPGTRVALTLPGLGDSAEPFVGRLQYRAHLRDGAECELEMRVYTANPGATDQPAVIAFHGGSWSNRRSGFPGMESLIAHFTDRGMVVFAPFYRLVDAQDGPEACQQWQAEDVLDDAEAALDWVQQTGGEYGAAPGKPVLFGQSAGAPRDFSACRWLSGWPTAIRWCRFDWCTGSRMRWWCRARRSCCAPP